MLAWSLDDNPPDERARHHIKEASFYGVEEWSVDLVIKAGELAVDHVGIREAVMWPGKRAQKEKGGRAMEMFEEMDAWLEESKGGTVDATMVGCVGGVTVL